MKGLFAKGCVSSFSTLDVIQWQLVYLLMGASQGAALALRERVVVVRGIISILCKVYLVMVRISSFSTMRRCLYLNLFTC